MFTEGLLNSAPCPRVTRVIRPALWHNPSRLHQVHVLGAHGR
ncbi:hypothetical protein FHU37_000828 [Allostreptomyces psammosilenae]|uniref:Uncharacterized protein n=1 Tax=Allostreptomyces psammosilenae TaxID=1892865 RepID=A0A852ZQ60_9ACTN|nr:hypothetical protein [Allostreptomyces psammosilenae]